MQGSCEQPQRHQRQYRPQGRSWDGASTMSTRGAATSTNSIALTRNRWSQPTSRDSQPIAPRDPYSLPYSSASSYSEGITSLDGYGGYGYDSRGCGIYADSGGGGSSSALSFEQEQYNVRIREQSSEPMEYYTTQPRSLEPAALDPELGELIMKLAMSPLSSSDLYYHLAAQPSIFQGTDEPRAQIEQILASVAALRRRELQMRQLAAVEPEGALHQENAGRQSIQTYQHDVSSPSYAPAASPFYRQSEPQSSPTETVVRSPSPARSTILPSTKDRSSSASIWAIKIAEPQQESVEPKRSERALELSRSSPTPSEPAERVSSSNEVRMKRMTPPKAASATMGESSGWSDPGDDQEDFQQKDQQHEQQLNQQDCSREPAPPPTSPHMAATPLVAGAQCPARQAEVESDERGRAETPIAQKPSNFVVEKGDVLARLTEMERAVLDLVHKNSLDINTVCDQLCKLHQESANGLAVHTSDRGGRDATPPASSTTSGAIISPVGCRQRSRSFHAMSREDLADSVAEAEQDNRRLFDEVVRLQAETAAHRRDFARWSRRTVNVVAELTRRIASKEDGEIEL